MEIREAGSIGEDSTVAERTCSPLTSSSTDGDDLMIREEICDVMSRISIITKVLDMIFFIESLLEDKDLYLFFYYTDTAIHSLYRCHTLEVDTVSYTRSENRTDGIGFIST